MNGRSINWCDSFYFTIINLTTVGLGDIVPKSQPGKWLSNTVGKFVSAALLARCSENFKPAIQRLGRQGFA